MHMNVYRVDWTMGPPTRREACACTSAADSKGSAPCRRPLWHHFGITLGPLGPVWQDFVNQMCQGCIQGDPHGTQSCFLKIFDGLWGPSWGQFGVTFRYFLCFGVTKCWSTLQPYSLMDSEWKIISFPMSQPLKNTVNTVVFIRFHFFHNFWNLMVSGTILETILEALGLSRTHLADFWGSWRLLRISINFRVFSETPRILRPLPGEGKKPIPRAHYYRQYGGYSMQNVTYSMEHGTWRLKGCKWCMKPYSSQPGGPWQAGAGG